MRCYLRRVTPPPLTDNLIESILYEDEGAALDFKRGPYPFEGAERHQKGELLKDILAFANAFRRTTAYILIGVEDVPGGRGIVHGVDRHPDDASLQQFVNEKTNRPIAFRYRAREVEGKQIGIIEIPVQPRPLYLTKDYGKLKARAVYVRRGSSTSEATPDEVARMGASLPATSFPELDVALGRAEEDLRIGLHLEAPTVVFRLPASIPDYANGPVLPGGGVLDFGSSNRNYWRDAAAYARDLGRLRSFQVVIENVGTVPLLRGRVVLRAPRNGGFDFAHQTAAPPNTSPYGHLAHIVGKVSPAGWGIVERGDAWEASSDTGTILPGGTVWTPELFVGANQSGHYEMDIAILGENLPLPLRLQASVTLNVSTADITFEEIRGWEGGLPPIDLLHA